jgi:hypothetical protein
MRNVYIAVSRAPITPSTYSAQCHPPSAPWKAMISSLDNQPEKGGMADSARPPTTKQAKVKGMARRKPPMRSSDCSPAMAEMSEPAAMNSSALKKACVMRWNMPAA